MNISESKFLKKPKPAPITRIVCFEKIPKKIRIKLGAGWYNERIGETFTILAIDDGGFYAVFDKSYDMVRYIRFRHASMKLINYK